MPAPADTLVHPLAGLRARIRLMAARRSGLVGGVLAGVTLAAVSSCAAIAIPVSAGTTTWWQGTGGASACGPPAVYRINGGALQRVGDCAGILLIPPTHVIVAVGSEIEVHITEEGSGTSGDQLVPIYPTPSSDDTSVLKPTLISDGGSTESFVAVGPGTANVATQAFCLVPGATTDPVKSCPVLEVGVS